ncbi:hypothetical protein C6P40_000044 [Pichia californica]|uniref:Zn(2)-C6 fungal-type domain-containing protein n=1 Tax=Pichia californica TaxID=460514 RepID=A0A9P7BG71_9ASCO|nr:hypothetical protein C6P42_000796 [[Candida] californica]KAG0691427.1 hypothetical protein C6P40_000044 [[Candida] californica]
MEEKKDLVVRNRKIASCQRCYKSKRKCDKSRPSCLRCQRVNQICTYFTKEETRERYHIRKVINAVQPNNKEISPTNGNSSQNTEINPRPNQTENQNFSIIVSSTGEYSKFFPKCFFSFFDHAQNISMILNPMGSKNKSLMVFNFSCLVTPFKNLNDIKARIPSIKTSDFLVNHFFDYILPFIPIVDKNEFFYEYKIFWEKPNSFNNKNFLFLMFSIYFCSCTSLSILKIFIYTSKFKNISIKKDIMELDCENLRFIFYECIENLRIVLNSNSNPSISIITGLTLIYYIGSANGNTISVKISSLVKISQIFGLHRKLTTNNSGAIRDILYKFVWYLDGLSAYYSGFPPNMHPEICESDEIYSIQSNDINYLFLSARLCNTHFWNIILFEFNKINKTDIKKFKEIESIYNNSINIVNDINEKILNFKDKSKNYKKWLTTETKMGLRKSMLLLSALKHSLSYKENNIQDKKLTNDLVLNSLLLINESIYKVKLGMKVLPNAIWFYRFAIPFQAMYIVLSHLQRYPLQRINFSYLKENIDYTVDDDDDDDNDEGKEAIIDYLNGDIRLDLINLCIDTISFLTTFWIPSNIERFNRLIKFRDYIIEKINSNITSCKESSVDSFEEEKIEENHEKNQNQNLPSMVINEYNECPDENMNLFDFDAYAFLNEGSKYWFGEEFEI